MKSLCLKIFGVLLLLSVFGCKINKEVKVIKLPKKYVYKLHINNAECVGFNKYGECTKFKYTHKYYGYYYDKDNNLKLIEIDKKEYYDNAHTSEETKLHTINERS